MTYYVDRVTGEVVIVRAVDCFVGKDEARKAIGRQSSKDGDVDKQR